MVRAGRLISRIRKYVSMKSGLEGRNNAPAKDYLQLGKQVSMKSGLEGRNNPRAGGSVIITKERVSMKSGLEGRNNPDRHAECL